MKSILEASQSLRESQKIVQEKLSATPAQDLEGMYAVHVGLKVGVYDRTSGLGLGFGLGLGLGLGEG